MIKTVAPVEWRGIDEPAPVWEKTIADIFPADVIVYVQKLAGYCLTGMVKYHILIICFGTGSNGKSLFFETLGNVLGEYAFRYRARQL